MHRDEPPNEITDQRGVTVSSSGSRETETAGGNGTNSGGKRRGAFGSISRWWSGLGQEQVATEKAEIDALFRAMPFFRRWWRRHEKERLAARIIQAGHHYAELGRRMSRPGHGSPDTALIEYLEGTREALLTSARKALFAGHVNAGWRILNLLEREMVHSLHPAEVEAQILSCAAEADEKLDGWRKEAVNDQWLWIEEHRPKKPCRSRDQAVGKAADEARAAPRAEAEDRPKHEGDATDASWNAASRLFLWEMQNQLHTRHSNVYMKQALLGRQVRAVSAWLLVLLAAILALNALGWFDPLDSPVPISIQQRLNLGILSGLTGGLLSVAYTVMRLDRSRRIPEISSSWLVTLVRPIVGALLALPVMIFFESGVIAVPVGERSWWLLALCMLAGFSERWFLGLMKRFGDQTPG